MSKSIVPNGKPQKQAASSHRLGLVPAAIYARVSTEDQGKGYSISTQIEACQALARREGYTVPEIYVLSDDLSGTTMERPGLRQLCELIQMQLGAGGLRPPRRRQHSFWSGGTPQCSNIEAFLDEPAGIRAAFARRQRPPRPHPGPSNHVKLGIPIKSETMALKHRSDRGRNLVAVGVTTIQSTARSSVPCRRLRFGSKISPPCRDWSACRINRPGADR